MKNSLGLALATTLLVFSGCSKNSPVASTTPSEQAPAAPARPITHPSNPTTPNQPTVSPPQTPTKIPSANSEWIDQLGASGAQSYGYGLTLDATNAVYVTGTTSGALNGNTQSGDSDLFTAKYDATGSLLWVKQLGSRRSTTEGKAVAMDHANHLYVAGYTTGTFKRIPQSGTQDIVIAQYDSSSGDLLWIKQFGANSASVAQGIAVDSQNQIYVSGYTTAALPGATQSGNQDLFIAKLDSAGNLLWVRQVGAPDQYTYSYRIAIDHSDNAYLTGYTTGGLNGITQKAHDAAFVTKYDSQGNLLWLHELAGPSKSASFGYGIAVDSANNVYLAGSTDSALGENTQSGVEDLLIAKYDSSGNFIWAQQLGRQNGRSAGHDLAIDGSDHLFVAGTTTIALGDDPQIGRKDFFVAKYDSSGALMTVRQMGTEGLSSAFGVAVDSSNDVYVSGFTGGALAGNAQSGDVDFFTARLTTY